MSRLTLLISHNQPLWGAITARSYHPGGVSALLADGSVRLLRLGNRSADDLRKLFQIGGFKDDDIGEPAVRPNWPNIAALLVWLLSVGTGTPSVSPNSISTRSASISALMTKALPVWRWQSRQWQQWTNIGAVVSA